MTWHDTSQVSRVIPGPPVGKLATRGVPTRPPGERCISRPTHVWFSGVVACGSRWWRLTATHESLSRTEPAREQGPTQG